MTREALQAHYLAVADASRHPVLVYNMPQNTGISLEPRLVVELSSHPNIVGLKESSGSLAFLAEVVREVPDRFPLPPRLGVRRLSRPCEMGACGAILAVANAAPEMCGRDLRAVQGREEGRGPRSSSSTSSPSTRPLMEIYGIAGLKYAQDLRGYSGGPTRLPLLPVDDKGRAEIAALVETVGF